MIFLNVPRSSPKPKHPQTPFDERNVRNTTIMFLESSGRSFKPVQASRGSAPHWVAPSPLHHTCSAFKLSSPRCEDSEHTPTRNPIRVPPSAMGLHAHKEIVPTFRSALRGLERTWKIPIASSKFFFCSRFVMVRCGACITSVTVGYSTVPYVVS